MQIYERTEIIRVCVCVMLAVYLQYRFDEQTIWNGSPVIVIVIVVDDAAASASAVVDFVVLKVVVVVCAL